jgi:hypothetical protein
LNPIDMAIVVFLLTSFPVGVWVFARKKVDWEGIKHTCDKYRWHIAMLFGLFILKTLIMSMESTVEGAYGWDATPLIHAIEGDAVLQVQKALLNDWMTLAMGIVYIGSFLFVYVFTFLLFAYSDKFKIAGSLMFMYLALLLMLGRQPWFQGCSRCCTTTIPWCTDSSPATTHSTTASRPCTSATRQRY